MHGELINEYNFIVLAASRSPQALTATTKSANTRPQQQLSTPSSTQEKIYLNTSSRLDESGCVFGIHAMVRDACLRSLSFLVLHVNVPPFERRYYRLQIHLHAAHFHKRLTQFMQLGWYIKFTISF